MTSSRLTSVAADLRAKAKAATPGPWRTIRGGDGGVWAAEGYGMAATGCGEGNAALIAVMHPDVALALADILDAAVFFAENYPDGLIGHRALALCDAYEGSVDMRAEGGVVSVQVLVEASDETLETVLRMARAAMYPAAFDNIDGLRVGSIERFRDMLTHLAASSSPASSGTSAEGAE